MPIAIPDEFKTFVSRGVASGRFRTEEEAVCEGLNLLSGPSQAHSRSTCVRPVARGSTRERWPLNHWAAMR